MASHSLLFVLAVAAVWHSAAAASSVILHYSNIFSNCKHSPTVWCSSDEVAESCGVLRQCQNDRRVHFSADPVNVTLYMESLCPDCKAFFKSQFYPTWQKLKQTGIMTIDAVPYGNAKEHVQGHRWLFECQHGPAECEGNQIETCAIGILRSPERWMPYLACLEERWNKNNINQTAQQCAKEQKISYEHIHTCAHNEWGDMLQHNMAARTEKLNPSHTYVPWITVNGVHNEEIQKQAESNLLNLVCSTYKGTKPAVCKQSSRCYRN